SAETVASKARAALDSASGTQVVAIVPSRDLDPRQWAATTRATMNVFAGNGTNGVPLIAPAEVADLGFLAAASVDDASGLAQLGDDVPASQGAPAPKGAATPSAPPTPTVVPSVVPSPSTASVGTPEESSRSLVPWLLGAIVVVAVGSAVLWAL